MECKTASEDCWDIGTNKTKNRKLFCISQSINKQIIFSMVCRLVAENTMNDFYFLIN